MAYLLPKERKMTSPPTPGSIFIGANVSVFMGFHEILESAGTGHKKTRLNRVNLETCSIMVLLSPHHLPIRDVDDAMSPFPRCTSFMWNQVLLRRNSSLVETFGTIQIAYRSRSFVFCCCQYCTWRCATLFIRHLACMRGLQATSPLSNENFYHHYVYNIGRYCT